MSHAERISRQDDVTLRELRVGVAKLYTECDKLFKDPTVFGDAVKNDNNLEEIIAAMFGEFSGALMGAAFTEDITEKHGQNWRMNPHVHMDEFYYNSW